MKVFGPLVKDLTVTGQVVLLSMKKAAALVHPDTFIIGSCSLQGPSTEFVDSLVCWVWVVLWHAVWYLCEMNYCTFTLMEMPECVCKSNIHIQYTQLSVNAQHERLWIVLVHPLGCSLNQEVTVYAETWCTLSAEHGQTV